MKITWFRSSTFAIAAGLAVVLGGGLALAASTADGGATGGPGYLQELSSLERETDRLDTWLIRIGVLQAVIFFAQFVAFIVQAIKLHQTVEAARRQAVDTAQSVEHAARGAVAMEAVAVALTRNSEVAAELLNLQKEVFRKNLRAYLTVRFQAHLPEDVQKNNRHEVRVAVVNTGNTPARAITVSHRLRVMPIPLPTNTDLALPTSTETYGFLPAHEDFYIRSWLEGFLPEAENTAIKSLQSTGLYVYGVVKYTDIFDQQQTLNFCKLISWDTGGNSLWMTISGRNDAT